MASALASVDISDSAHLKILLTETESPLVSIKEFQKSNAIALESLAPALPLLDLHGVSRFDFHDSVFEQLKLMLERRIEDIAKLPKEESYQSLMKILDKAFPLASAPLLRPLIMRVLTKIDNIPEEHLNALVQDPALYKSAPLEVRRHIWLSNPSLFCQEVREEITNFTVRINEQITNFKQNQLEYLSDPRVRRKNCPFLNKIVEMTRANSTLYKKAIESIKDEFKSAPLHNQPFIASLRGGLLMALHESEHQEMVSTDCIYKFAWCIDASVRAKQISELQQRELYEFLSTVKASKTLRDISMVLFDPAVQNLLMKEIQKEIQNIFHDSQMPKSSQKLRFLLRLMKLGSQAPEFAKNEISSDSPVDDILVTQLITSIVICLAKHEDQKLENEIHGLQKTQENNNPISIIEFEPLWKQIISAHGRFSGQLLRLHIKLLPDISYPIILPLFGRNCRDMLSDQLFLHEVGHYIWRKKNYSDEFLTPFLLKFLLSGKQAREVAAAAATKLMEIPEITLSDAIKAKCQEKLKAPGKKEKKKEKEKDKKKDKKKSSKIEKSKKKEISKEKKLKIKLQLTDATDKQDQSTESE